MTATQIADYQQRNDALNPEKSFAVSAPAGSGKTEILSRRILTLLSRCEKPEHILAITFTKKAASEMRDRIASALALAEETKPDDDFKAETWELAKQVLIRSKQLNWELTENINRLKIQTIDGLCRTLANQLPLDSGQGIMPETLIDPTEAYQTAVKNLLDNSINQDDSDIQDSIGRLLAARDNQLLQFERLCIALLEIRDQWLPLILQLGQIPIDYFTEVIRSLINDEISFLYELLKPYYGEITELLDYAAQNLSTNESTHEKTGEEADEKEFSFYHSFIGCKALPEVNFQSFKEWLLIAEWLTTHKGELRSKVDKRQGFIPPTQAKDKTLAKQKKLQMQNLLSALSTNPLIAEQLSRIKTLPYSEIPDHQLQSLIDLINILPRLAAELELVFQEKSACDFISVTQAALSALGNEESPTELALQLDYRIHHILVDEFQDTSATQLQLLEALTRGWQPGDRRTLFVVGDGMQSIYGFRNANVGIFLQARKNGIGDLPLIPLDLTVNFRSNPSIVNWINHSGQQIFPVREDISQGAVTFYPAEARDFDTSKDKQQSKIQIDIDIAESNVYEATRLVSEIEKILLDYPEDNIGILVRSRSHAKELLTKLAEKNIPWQANEMDLLSSKIEVIDVISLTRAVCNPEDRIAWLSILRCPWCGLSPDDFLTICRYTNEEEQLLQSCQIPRLPSICNRLLTIPWIEFESNRDNITNLKRFWSKTPWKFLSALSTDGFYQIEKLSKNFQMVWKNRHRKSLRDLVEGLWLSLGGPACLKNKTQLNNIEHYFDFIGEYTSENLISDWPVFYRKLDKLYAETGNTLAKIHVMTIHKSKGLEFDSVILPSLQATPRQDEKPLLHYYQRISMSGSPEWLVSVIPPTGKDDQLYDFLHLENKRKQKFEATRLLYVAMTRAKKRLLLSACVKDKSKKPGVSLLQSLWPIIISNKESNLNSNSNKIKEPYNPDLPIKNYNSHCSIFWHDHSNEETTATLNGFNANEEKQKEFNIYINQLPASHQLTDLTNGNLLSQYRGRSQGFGNSNILKSKTLSENQQISRVIGTIIHQILESLANSPLPNNTNSWLKQRSVYWYRRLEAHPVTKHHASQLIDQITDCIKKTLNDQNGRWLLDYGHQDSGTEVSVSYFLDGRMRDAVIDRTFIYQNSRWLIDYKTGLPDSIDERSIKAFIADEIKINLNQLSNYTELMRNIKPQFPVITALYFPRLPHLEVIELAN